MRSDRPSEEPTQRQVIVIAEAESPPTGINLSSSMSTFAAPTYAAPVKGHSIPELKVGDRIDDFELVRELGKGGFATVYLARQVSLGRQVALKVGPNKGHEAQTMASLEHDHIVHVFSETVIAARQARLLCMQYVAGATLADVGKQLTPEIRAGGTGTDFLAALERVSHQAAEFHPSALQERQLLAEGTFHEALCWLGARLSSALEFAHDRGVLHRDIKPANILINPFGRPFLADFNLATRSTSEEETQVGGTLPYMSPEQLRAFISREDDDWNKVDARSDVYSLGVVLFELAMGMRPYSCDLSRSSSMSEAYQTLAQQRSVPVDSLQKHIPTIPFSLDMVIRKCLAPNPDERYASAAELRQALDTCRLHLRSLHQLPPPAPLMGYFHRHPFISLLLIPTFTNILATIVNWSYNLIQIVGDFTPAQRTAFDGIVIVYNSIAFPVLVGLTAWLLYRRHKEWTELNDGRLVTSADIAGLRHRINFLATWSIYGSLIGWLPGGPIFSGVVHWFGEPLNSEQFIHFLISFTLSGLIAITYCYLGSQYVVLRVLLPQLCGATDQGDQSLRQELKRLPSRLLLFQVLAGVIPLSGALMIVMIGNASRGDNWFRLLVCLLIVLGMVGFVFALRITHYLQRVLGILLNPERRGSDMRS
ncbi:MAG: serine/threonine-protein kinase [Gemmatales bacterium]